MIIIMDYYEFEQLAREWAGEICIFGAGLIGQTWGYDLAESAGFKVDYFCDNHIPAGTVLRDGKQVISLQELYRREDDVLVLLAARSLHQEEIKKQLLRNGVTHIVEMSEEFAQEMYLSLEKNASSGLLEKYKRFMDDGEYLKRRFEYIMKDSCSWVPGRNIDLEHPETFNEKLQWLKMYDHRPEYTMMVDKYLVRKYIADRIGERYLIPLIGVWDDPDRIDFAALPDQFVLKCNHNSGLGVCICRDKAKINQSKVKEELRRGLNENYYICGREWPYKNVPKKIICEKYLTNTGDAEELTDYKFFCFNGKADNVMIVTGRTTGDPKFYHFSKDWKLCRYNRLGRSLPENYTMQKPALMDEMFHIAERLSAGIPQVRVDLYVSENRIHFGELTFFNVGGFETGFDLQSDLHLGKMIKLPPKQV